MKKIYSALLFSFIANLIFGQAYLKLSIDSSSSLTGCNMKVVATPYGGTLPYMITWWDNSWQPSTGMQANNICPGTILTVEILDHNCRMMNGHLYVDSIPSQQIWLDTVIVTMPSGPGMCDGAIEFKVRNLFPGCTRHFSTPGSGFTTTDSIFTGLCDNYYGYAIYAAGFVRYEVLVSLHYPSSSTLHPCIPITDSVVTISPSTSASCDGEIHDLSYGPPAASMKRYMYMPVTGGTIQINSDITNEVETNVCPGPYIVDTYSTSNLFWVRSTIYVDDPEIPDSTWGEPPLDSLIGGTPVDTIVLNAITNCGLDYTAGIDTAYVSNVNWLEENNYEIEITIVQDSGTVQVYQTCTMDTTHITCFDITVFCADSTLTRTSVNPYRRNIIFLKPYEHVMSSGTETTMNTYGLQAYPNPTTGTISIEAKEIIRSYTLSDLSGKTLSVNTSTTNRIQVDLSNLEDGFYLITVSFENNASQALKITKQKK